MSHQRVPCPQCDRGKTDRAMSVTTDELGTVSYCHRCEFTAWVPRAGGHQTHRGGCRAAQDRPAGSQPLEWSERAQAIWDRTKPLAGSVGAVYLEWRGCRLPPVEGDLRFLSAVGELPQSLCARVTDVVTGKPLTLHFTRLATDGRGKAYPRGSEKPNKLLLGGHRKKGGCIRLWPDEAVTTGLAIAEGIETALAAAHVFTPVWATVDAGNLESFPVLAGIQVLTIFADHDQAGMQASQACAARWSEAAREMNVFRAREPGADAADVARLEQESAP